MTLYEPTAAKVQGMTRVVFCTSVANTSAPSIASEINATSSVEATMAMYGTFNPTANVNTGNAPARLGTTVQLPEEGNAQLQPIQIAYPYDPSKDKTDANNKLWALLTQGTTVYAVVRRGVATGTAFATGDVVTTYELRCGYQDRNQTGEDEFAENQIQQNLFQLVEPVDGALAA